MRGIFFAALWMLFASGAQGADCRLQQLDSIPITVEKSRIYLPLQLGDAHKNFALQLESAADEVSEEIASSLDLMSAQSIPM